MKQRTIFCTAGHAAMYDPTEETTIAIYMPPRQFAETRSTLLRLLGYLQAASTDPTRTEQQKGSALALSREVEKVLTVVNL